MKPEGQAQGCIFRRLMVFNPLGGDSPFVRYGCGQLVYFLWSEILACSCPSNHMWFLLLLAECPTWRTLPCSHRCVVRWGEHMLCPRVYCLCQAVAGLVSFSTIAPVQSLITANQLRTSTRVLSPSSMWRTPVTESRYLFDRMDWVNIESERKTEIVFLPWVGFELTTSWSTVKRQRVTTELSSISMLNNVRHIYKKNCFPFYLEKVENGSKFVNQS